MSEYVQSVLDLTDEFGILSPGDARKLIRDRGLLWGDWVREKPMGALACEARPLLHWLGY